MENRNSNIKGSHNKGWDVYSRREARGSFTVEAALVMTVLLPVIVALIYAAFFLHDRALLQGAACEVTAMGSNLSEAEDQLSRLNKLKDQLVSARLLGTRNIQCSLSADKDRIRVSYTGTFPIPGMILQLLGNSSLPLEQLWSRELFHPADMIRKIRGLEYMIDSIKG